MKLSFSQIAVILTLVVGFGGLLLIVAQKGNDIESKYREVIDVFAVARDVGLDIEQFKTDIDSKEVHDKVAADDAEGLKRLNNQPSTPAVFINETLLENRSELELKLDELVAQNQTIKVEEFFDYMCPHCASFVNFMLNAEAKYGDKVTFEYRNLPFLRPASTTYAYAGEAARKQGKFKEYYVALFTAIHGADVVNTIPVSSPQ